MPLHYYLDLAISYKLKSHTKSPNVNKVRSTKISTFKFDDCPG